MQSEHKYTQPQRTTLHTHTYTHAHCKFFICLSHTVVITDRRRCRQSHRVDCKIICTSRSGHGPSSATASRSIHIQLPNTTKLRQSAIFAPRIYHTTTYTTTLRTHAARRVVQVLASHHSPCCTSLIRSCRSIRIAPAAHTALAADARLLVISLEYNESPALRSPRSSRSSVAKSKQRFSLIR